MTTYLAKPLTEELRSRIVGNPDRFLLLAEEGQVLCDFCGDPYPSLMYTASRLARGAKAPNWVWCSCEPCSKLIEAEDWEALRELMYKCYEGPLMRVFPAGDQSLVRRAIDCSLFDLLLYATKVEVKG